MCPPPQFPPHIIPLLCFVEKCCCCPVYVLNTFYVLNVVQLCLFSDGHKEVIAGTFVKFVDVLDGGTGGSPSSQQLEIFKRWQAQQQQAQQ